MKRQRKKYHVYIRRRGFGCYDTGEDLLFFAGDTWAVSEKQAVNNVRFRREGETGNLFINGDYAGAGDVIYVYEAKEADESNGGRS